MQAVLIVFGCATFPTRSIAAQLDGAAAGLCSDLVAKERHAHGSQITLIQSRHEEAISKLQSEIERLKRACSNTALRSSNRTSALAFGASSPAVAGSEPILTRTLTHSTLSRAHTESARAALAMREIWSTPQLGKTAGRELLRSENGARYCSKADVQSIIDLSASPELHGDRIVAVTQIQASNPQCGSCIFQVVNSSSEPVNLIVELLGCWHQEENRCDATTGASRIASSIPLASVADRDSLVRMIELVEAGAGVTVMLRVPAQSFAFCELFCIVFNASQTVPARC
jgi:hypothetical protein